jgi:hypothetical protein
MRISGLFVQHMKPQNSLAKNTSDLVVYCLLPAISVLIPASFSRKLIALMSSWSWLLSSDASECFKEAAKYISISNQRDWKCRWRLVVMLEVRDLALLSCGRSKSVFNEIEGSENIEVARDKVLVGMHWGPSIAILSLLQSAGLKPLLVYRPVERSIFEVRPFLYFFLKRSVRYIHRTCGEQRAITIKGAGAALRRELPMPGSSVVVLDAPPAPGRSTIGGTVLGHTVKFNAGFPEILIESGREYLFYAITLNDKDMLRSLELMPPKVPKSSQQLIGDYCEFLSTHIQADSAQWRIWQVAGQFFQSAANDETGNATQE